MRMFFLIICVNFSELESRYLQNRFKTFIKEFNESLNGKNCDNFSQNIEDVQAALTKIQTEVGSRKSVQYIINKIDYCNERLVAFNNETNLNNKLLLLSDLFMNLNYIEAIFNSNLSLIDPLAKKALKKKYCLQSIRQFEDIKTAFELQSQAFIEGSELHSYIKPVNALLKRLKNKNEELGKYVAVRSKTVLYETMLKVGRLYFISK